MRTDRIVRRNGLKEKLAELEEITRTSRVIAATQAMLQNVMREGFAKGWEAREDAYNKAEAEAKQKAIDAVNAEIIASNLRTDPTCVAELCEAILHDEPTVGPTNS